MNGGMIRRRILRAQAFAALSAVLCCLSLVTAVHAGQKTYLDNVITDDLTTGFGAGVGLTGDGVEVTGGLGQVMTVEVSLANTAAESGYFSKVVDTPTASDFYEVFYTSFSVAWIGVNNPDGTQYVIELSTAADFSALRSSGTFSVSPATLEGLENGTTYYTRIKAVYGDSDESDWAALGSTQTIYNPLPTASVLVPANNSAIYVFGAISGTVADDSGIADVYISIQRMTDNKYYDGAGFTLGSQTWLMVTGAAPPAWSYSDLTGAKLTDGASYTIAVKTRDNQGEWSAAYSTSAFTYDLTPPVSRITAPAAGGYITSSLPTISGTSYDGGSGQMPGASGLKLRVYYTDMGGTWYWNGTTALGWSSTAAVDLPVDFTASNSTITWNYPPATYDLPTISTNNQVYTFSIAGMDVAGNMEAIAPVSVTSDFDYPLIAISTPMPGADGFYSPSFPMGDIRGTAFDAPAGIMAPVKVQLSKLRPDLAVEQRWDGEQWIVTASTWLPAAGTTAWSYTTPALPDNKRYKVDLWAQDYAGNQPPDGTYAAEFIYDVNKPSSTITVPSQAYYNLAQISVLSGTAVDWVNYPSTESYSGIAPSGAEIQIVDVTNGGLTYDGLVFGPGSFWRPTVMTNYGATDAYFGVQLSSSVSWSYPAGADMWPPALAEGNVYKVRARARDRSQNLEDYVEAQFAYDNYAPTTTVTMPAALAYKALPEIKGDFTETVSGLHSGDGVQVAIKRNDTSAFWDGSSWGTFSALNWRNATAIFQTTWTYTDPALMAEFSMLTGSAEFTLYVRGQDAAGNKNVPDTPAPTGGTAFKIDQFKPVSITTYPAAGGGATVYLKTPPASVAGTASDADAGTSSGLSNVYVRVRRYNWVGTECYYDPVAENWSSNPGVEAWMAQDAGTLEMWTRTNLLPAFQGNNTGDCNGGADKGDGYRFEVQSYAVDNTQAVNGGPNTETVYSTAAFVLDYSSPTAGITAPAHMSFVSAVTALSGTASDTLTGGNFLSGLATIEYELTDTDAKPAMYWNFGAGQWQLPYVSSAVPASALWTKTSLPNNNPAGSDSWAVGRSSATFLLRTRVFDKAGNYSSFDLSYSTFTLDLVPPVSAMTLPSANGLTFASMASIAGTSYDAYSGIGDIMIKMWYEAGGTTYYWYPSGTHWQAAEPGWLGIGAAGPPATQNPWLYTHSDFMNPGAPVYAWKEATHDGLSGKTFYIAAKAVDSATNEEVNFSTRNFIFDNEPPVSRPTMPGTDTSYNSMNSISGTVSEDTGTVASLKVSILSEEEPGGAKYFDGSGFNQVTETWLTPTELYTSSWTYVNATLSSLFANGFHYVVRSSATDNIGNVQSVVGQSRFLFDATKPDTSVTSPQNAYVYADDKSLVGLLSDPGYTSGINGTGSGVYPSLPWHQGKIETVVFRDTAPLMGSAGPMVYGPGTGWDDSGYFWNGSTWTDVDGGPVWVPAQFDTDSTWLYQGLVCDDDTERTEHTCWVKGDSYASWVRVTDNAGNLQTAINDGPKFYISAPAKSFLVTVDQDPMTAGDIVNITVEAKDELNGAGNTAQGYLSTVTFHMDMPADGPEYMGTTDPEAIDEVHGLPKEYKFVTSDYGLKQFQMRLRKSGNRTLNVSDKDNGGIYANKAVVVNASTADRVQVIADYDPSGELPAPGTPSGITGAPRTRAAGASTVFLLQVTDLYWNLVVSSAASVYVTDTDSNNDSVSPDGYADFMGSTTVSRTFVTADPVGWTVSATGQGLYVNSRNPSSRVPVSANAADRLLALFTGESRVEGKYGSAPYGKTGTPSALLAGSAFTVTVYGVDAYYNTDTTAGFQVTASMPEDRYNVDPPAVSLVAGTTGFVFTPVVAGSQTVKVESASLPPGTSYYVTPSSATVWWNVPTKLLLVAPGQTLAPGKPPYDMNPATGGTDGTPVELTAGVAAQMSVYLVDNYFNVIQDVTPFMAVSSNTPLVRINFNNDPNIQLRGLLPDPYYKTLEAGATTFDVIPVTRNQSAGLSVQVEDTGVTGTYFSTDTVSGLTVNPGAALKLLLLAPGETAAEGTVSGKTGAPSAMNTGDSYALQVRAVDAYNNLVIDGRNVGIQSDDAAASNPAPGMLVNGSRLMSGFIPRTPTSNLTINAVDLDGIVPLLAAGGISGIRVHSAVAGCDNIVDVSKFGGGEYVAIQPALDSLPVPLTANTCVVIRDTETYSEQVTVKNFDNNGYRLKIMADPSFVSSAPVVNPPVASTAAFQVLSDSVTLQGIQIVSTNTVPYGVQASSADVVISSFMVDGAALINTAAISITTRAAVSNTMVFLNGTGKGLWVKGPSAAIADSYFVNSSGYAVQLDATAGLSSITRSTITANTGGAGFSIASSTNTISDSYIRNNNAYALYLGAVTNNTISRSTITSNNVPATLYFNTNASSNTLTESYVGNPSGTAVYMYQCYGNIIDRSTVSAAGSNYMGVYFNYASSNAVRDSQVLSANGPAVYFRDSSYNTVDRSTVTSPVFGSRALQFERSSTDTVSNSYLLGHYAAQIAYSTGTAINNSVLVSTWTDGRGLNLAFGSVNFTLSSSTIFGGASDYGIMFEAGNSGTITLSSDTFRGGRIGLGMGVPAAGATIAISSITFASLTAGATAIDLQAGQYNMSISSPVFDAGDVNVNGTLLTAGSRVVMYDAAGLKKGPLFEKDPSNYVIWWNQMDGCDSGVNVYGGGGGDYLSVFAAVNALPSTLSGNTCVVLRDSVLFSEQVSVRNLDTKGYRLKIMSDPGLVGAMPSFDPPASSTAAFLIEADSVSITGIDIVPTSALPYGIVMSSDNVTLSSVTVSGGTAINVAGIRLSSYSTVADSFVSVQAAGGLVAPLAVHSTLVRSTFTNNTALAYYALGFDSAESNTVEDCYINNDQGTGANLMGSNRNEIFRSTIASSGLGTGLYVDSSSSNTFTGNRVSGQTGNGMRLLFNSDDNTVTQNIITSAGGAYALYLNGSDLNHMSGNSITHGSGHATGLDGSNANDFTGDIMVGAGTGSRAFHIVSGSSNTVTGAYLAASAGSGVYFSGGYGNSVDLSTITSNSDTNAALYVQGASSNTFYGNYISNQPGTAVQLSGSANVNSISQSTITTAGPPTSVYIYSAGSNTISGSMISNTKGMAANISGTATENTFDQCAVSGSTSSRAAIELDGVSRNYFLGTSVTNLIGEALNFGSGSHFNTIRQSTVTSASAGGAAFYMTNSSTNTIDRSYFYNSAGVGAWIENGSNYNSILLSSFESGAAVGVSLVLEKASFNNVTGSFITNPYGWAMRFGDTANANNIAGSTVSAAAAGIYFGQVSSNTVVDSYVQGSTAAYVFGSSNTAIGGSRLVGAGTGGAALYATGISKGLFLATTTLSGDETGTALYLDAGNTGRLELSTLTVRGGAVGFTLAQQDALADVAVTSVTFAALSGGGTAINFLGGIVVSTFTAIRFDSADIAVNVNADALSSGSAITMRNPGGIRSGPVYATDTNGYVYWPGFQYLPSECGTGLSVKQDGTTGNTSIQAALDALPHDLTSDACVVIRDDGTYNESVTVNGFTNNGYRLKIMSDPTFVSSAPVITKDLLVYSASVTVHHIDFVPADAIGNAIYASGPAIYISSVNVLDSAGKITGTGVYFISTGGELVNSTVSVNNMIAVTLEGASFTAIRGSTLTNNADGFTTLYAYGSSSNTVSDCHIANVQGYAARIMTGSDYNTVVRSTFASNKAARAALYLAGNKWNTVTNSYITNPAGYGAHLDSYAENNTISYSTLTVGNGGYSALYIYAASSNTVSESYVYNTGGYGAFVEGGAGYNDISRSTVATGGGGKYAISLTNASHNTFEDDLFSAPAGYALSFYSGSHYNAITRSVLASNGTSMQALYMTGASSNTVMESVISHPSGTAAVINGNSVNNTISRSTMTCAHSAFRALEISGASSNTVSGSYIYNSAGYAAAIFGGANKNTISGSTVTSGASSLSALNVYGASSNTVSDSYLSNPYGNGANFSTGGNLNTIIRSTITAGGEAFRVIGTSSNTVLDSYMQGQIAATLNGSTGTTIGGSVLVSTWTESAALVLTGGNGAMTVSSSAVSGQTAVYFDNYNHGRLAFASVTIHGLAYGVYFTTQSADAVVDIDSMTFASLSPGATAMVFAGGQFVSTFTHVAFDDANIGVNVDGSGLYPGSMVRIASYSGPKGGYAFESDPFNFIHWGSAPGTVPVSAGSISTGSIVLQWSSPGADGDSGTLYNSSFTIQYTSVTADAQSALFWSTAAAQVTIPVNVVPQGTDESHVFENLTANTSYYFRIWTLDDEQNFGEPSAVTPIVTMIETPTGVYFHSIATTSVSVEADGPGFANLYEGQSDTGLEISTDALTWTFAGWLAGERSTFTVLTPNTPYMFRAKARNQAGVETGYSPTISTYTLAAVALPLGGTPLFSDVQLSSAAVNLSSGTAATGFNGPGAAYAIEISTMADHSVLFASATTTGLRLTSLNLLPNTTQYYRAQAYNSANVTDYSWLTLGEVSTLPEPPIAPQAAEVLFTTVTVAWTALPAGPSTATCEGYMVQASTAEDFSGTVLSSATGINTASSLAIEGLASDATYYFRVGSLNWAGAPDYAAGFSTVTLDNIPPAAVNDLSAGAVAGDTVDLYWTATGDNGPNAAAGLVTVSTGGVQPGENQHYSLSGLSGNTTYYFRLWTADEADNYSQASNEASTLMLPNPVTSPEYLTVYATNLTIAWVTAGNLPGTQYFAEASADAAFTLNTLSTVTTASNYTFNNLIPNTVYFARVKTLGTAGADSEYVGFGSTVTQASPIASPQVSAVYVTSATVSWDANSNPEGTFYDIVVSSDDFISFNYSTATDQTYFDFTGLAPNSTYYFRASAINADGLKSAQVMFPSANTYAAAPGKHSTSFPAVSASSVAVQWLANGNPGYTQYYVAVSTGADFTGTDAGPGSWTAATTIMVSPLNPYATYYFRAKAKDFLGRETAYTSLGSTRTLSGSDVIPPTVTDLQGGDDTWRGGASGPYKVYFADYGSGLSRFQVRITTAQNAGGTLIADWTDVVTNIFAQAYSSDWQLPPTVFQNIPENTTSYVSVRVYDNSSNVAVSTDVFYVRRDTTLPGITNNTVSTVTWIAADPGPIYDVDFADALSGLRYIQYSVSSQAGSASANILGWMDIAAVSSAPDYTADWGVNFNGLADAVTNYISVRAIDTAGNIRTTVDAFRILKNIKGPLVAITSPNTAYVSTITAVAGSATKRIDIAPVEGNELALMRAADALYWDGAGFNSVSQFWLTASGVDTWNVDVSTFGLVENSSYTAVARSRDINGKYSAVYATFTFTLDAAAPAVYLSTPTAGTTIYAFALVEGTAADPQPGSGVSAVEISVMRIVDGKWWNFMTSSWGEAVVSSRAVGGTAWRFYPDNALKGNATSGQSYFVTAQAKDAALPANSSPFGLAGSTFTILDAVPPGQVTQISASSGTSPGRILLNWIASGDDGSAVMLGPGSQFAIQYATYPSVALSTALAQVLVSTQGVLPGSTQYHHVTGLVPSVTYYLALWTQDDAGLWSDASPLVYAVSGESLNDQITGHVRMPSGTGITGVLVEAFDIFGSASLTVYTANDGLGTFAFTGIDDGLYRIQATWLANDLASTVSKDQIPMGYADVDFILSTEYELASISGTVPEAARAVVHTKGKAVSAADGAIELFQGSRRIAVARPDAAGNFSIRNLLPGTYTVHFPQSPGVKDVTVTLKGGENAIVAPLGELLRKNSVYAYPNPARNMITFHLQSDVATALRKVISVFGIDGKLVAEIKEDNAGWQSLTLGEYKFELNTSKLASGVYIYSVKVEDATTRGSKKIMGKFAIVK